MDAQPYKVFLGFGSNLGNRHAIISEAQSLTEKLIGPVVGQSAFYESQPWGFKSSNAFLNTVVCYSTTCSPREVLYLTQQVERQLGRRQKSAGGIYHDRPIDIDLLLSDHGMVMEYDLRIPHPLLLQRDFVLRPLTEVFVLLDHQYFKCPLFPSGRVSKFLIGG